MTLDFDEIYLKHRRRVYMLCLRMLKNEAEAEDLTQETFVQVFKKLDTFRGESEFTTWLHAIAVNQCLMHFRKRIVVNEVTTDDGVMPDRAVSMNVFDRISLAEALAAMPNGYRKVLMMHGAFGMEHEEVAETLGCSVGTSKSQFFKATAKMRRLLKRRVNPRVYAPKAVFAAA